MASHPDLEIDLDDRSAVKDSLSQQVGARPHVADLKTRVRQLRAEVMVLRRCVRDSIDLQKGMLECIEGNVSTTPVGPRHTPLASSTPYGMASGQPTAERLFCEFFNIVYLPSDSQEPILRGILDRRQMPAEPLPTFVAHMLGEFRKLKTPPPQQEQIDVIRKHALEKYRLALYGTPMPSAMDLLLRAHGSWSECWLFD
ncbi:hypothetical protein Q7C36_014208 [Tachysurus vachellii]|uniref:Uncharacterized protein n=1 Tax=Tachysurus vachellii TaxID=175792 RepID=A0AA88SK99_TACVA|nr:hypothetical protein Q7C36_014208 [Tachysurus vachellii]